MPLNFELTFEQSAIGELAEQLGRNELLPLAREAEEQRGVPESLRNAIAQSGLMPAVPEAYGGLGALEPMSFALVIGGLAKGDAAIAAALAWNACAAEMIARCGSDDQKERFLAPFMEPGFTASIACLEGFGRAPAEYETTIEQVEQGAWRVRGHKLAVPDLGRCDLLIVIGREPASGRSRAALLPRELRDALVVTESDLIGLAPTATATASFDCVVAEEALLGGANADWGTLARSIALFRLTTAFLALGAADAAVAYASEYANGREAFGKPISSFQAVAFLIADARIRVDASRLEAMEFVSGIETADLTTIEDLTAQILEYACEVAAAATRDCLQVLGGSGFITDHPIERWFRATAGLGALDFDPGRNAFSPAL